MSDTNGRSTIPSSSIDTKLLAQRLRLAMMRMGRYLRRQDDATLTLAQLSTLATLESCGPLTLGELAEAERVQSPTMTRLVDKLEAVGLISRMEDANDRRVVRVKITAAGLDLVMERRSRGDAFLATQLSVLEPEELSVLADAVDILERLLESHGEYGTSEESGEGASNVHRGGAGSR
ncbi:MAG: MarR family transcriptional regulator [Actinobacteria bacterium]|nr:MarR family transcriptional regulator [Actinomycetota bacterium]MCL6094487.1 MarR family transcriptional regulator [Actinomycetota bacterium]